MDSLQQNNDDNSYTLPPKNKGVVHPIASDQTASENQAANLIRQKISGLYIDEPDAKKEIAEAQASHHRSKHQKFMFELTNSGKSLADIQTEWHQYYVGLPDNEKHDVWQEFYANYNATEYVAPQVDQAKVDHAKLTAHDFTQPTHTPRTDKRTVSDIKSQLLGNINSRSRLSKKQYAQSLIFGVSMGSIVMLVLLFSFFNERFLAPFITPSRSVSATSIIIDPNSTSVDPNPEIIIPKINVEIPVVYDVQSIDEAAVDKGLEHGVVHYVTTPNPGEQGNVVVFGHSSNNIFNPGNYKFAFVLLNKLENGDLFMLTKDGKRYVYKVYQKRIVSPSEVSVLGTADKPSTATLITCDPPGTSLNRLVVTGEQITPDPATNTQSTAVKSDAQTTSLPSNSQSLWQRFWHWVSS